MKVSAIEYESNRAGFLRVSCSLAKRNVENANGMRTVIKLAASAKMA